VVGMEENLFPSGMVGDSPRALEEERRLFYVAITQKTNIYILQEATRTAKFHFSIAKTGTGI